jgi:hypothetical protein
VEPNGFDQSTSKFRGDASPPASGQIEDRFLRLFSLGGKMPQKIGVAAFEVATANCRVPGEQDGSDIMLPGGAGGLADTAEALPNPLAHPGSAKSLEGFQDSFAPPRGHSELVDVFRVLVVAFHSPGEPAANGAKSPLQKQAGGDHGRRVYMQPVSPVLFREFGHAFAPRIPDTRC